MKNQTDADLHAELEGVKARLAESEATIKAIRSGEVDAIVVEGPGGSRVFTLQSPEEPYRILAERMNEGAATLTAEGTILFCNQRLAEMVGLPAERLIGSPISSFLRDGGRKDVAERLSLALQNDVREEGHVLRNDGTMLSAQLSLSSVPLEESVQGLCLIVTDVSELKKKEQEVRERAALLESAHDAIIFRGMDGRIFFWNRGAKDLYGWSAEEAIGKLSHELLQPGFQEPMQRIEEIIRETREWEGELSHTSRNGTSLTVTSRWSLLPNERGKPPAILEINRDVTARKRAEEKLRVISRYTRSLIEASVDPLVTISREGQITDVNEATERVTGVSRDRLIGSDFSSYFTDPESARRGYEKAFAQGSVRDYPLAIRHISGQVTDVLYNASVFRDEAGDVRGVFAAARDIIERRRAEDEVRRLNAELEQEVTRRTEELRVANKDLEAFTYAVAHDLRAPLRHIHGFSELLLHDGDSTLSADGQHFLDCILEGTSRMEGLLEDLLNLSRLGRQTVNRRTTHLEALVQEVIDDLASDTADRQIEWKVGDLPVADCDPSLMKIVFVNLLSNAVKFTRPRTTATIEVGQMMQNGERVLFVKDNGAGFEMKYADKLFGVFQRLHRQNQFEGTGIGLATVHRILQKHGGRIWAESELDKGTTFYFTFGRADAIKEQPVAVAEVV